MGLAAQHPGGQVRLGVSATVASAVLYSAVVLFGLGPASPSAQGRETDRNATVVRVPRDPAVSGPAQRLPQVSPGSARRQPRRLGPARGEQVTTGAVAPIAAGDNGKSSPEPPRTPKAKPKAVTSQTSVVQASGPAPSPTPGEPDPVVTVPELPVTVPDPPVTVTVPVLPVPLPPVQVPTVPALPLP
jgi:hypothetical protein